MLNIALCCVKFVSRHVSPLLQALRRTVSSARQQTVTSMRSMAHRTTLGNWPRIRRRVRAVYTSSILPPKVRVPSRGPSKTTIFPASSRPSSSAAYPQHHAHTCMPGTHARAGRHACGSCTPRIAAHHHARNAVEIRRAIWVAGSLALTQRPPP